MPWYKAGTVSVVQNSNVVTGTNTAFFSNGRVGDAFRGPDGGWYEVINIPSETSLAISPNYLGATNSSGAYALAPMQGYVKDSADALRALVNQFGGVMAVLGEIPTQAGVRNSLNLTNTDGLPEGLTNKYMTAAGVRGTTLTGLDLTVRTPVVATDSVLAALGKLQASKEDTSSLTALIAGLIPSRPAPTSLTFSSGTAYIPGLGRRVTVSADITLSGLALPASVWYYAYLYENSGAAAIELVTTAPAAPYMGSARTKAGDTTRRFIGAFRSSTNGGVLGFTAGNDGMINYRDNLIAAPYRVLSNGAATAPTIVVTSAIVPINVTKSVRLSMNNNGTPVANLAPGNFNVTMVGAEPGGKVSCDTTLDDSGNLWYFNSGTGGSLSIDITGYGMDR
ncbi:hypothetical protein [Pseudomonas sp. MD195_PC81_125]|uniref:hypothetical protein n=1 Tax=Pseudomonas sp. MD195_PC81_125 TaxID=2741560 RepID=UPI002740969A|nr:hypothetical protein [Pseudomonas sp. MD195_PC81_125]